MPGEASSANPKTPSTPTEEQPQVQTVAEQYAKPKEEEQPKAEGLVPPPPFRIVPMRKRARFLKLLTYGAFGVGKTLLCGSAVQVPQMRDVLMITAEGGEETLEDIENSDLIDIVRVTRFDQAARIHEFLKAHCKARDEGDDDKLLKFQERLLGPLQEGDRLRRYQTCIIDSLSEVEQYCMYQLLGITDATRLDEETASAEWGEYKRNHQMIQRLVRKFRDLPMHVLITAAQQYNQDETKKYKYTLQLTGKLATQVQGFMDMVGYLVVGQGSSESSVLPRRLYIQPSPSGRFDAKNRFTGYDSDHIDKPTMARILDAVGLLKRAAAKT